MSEGYENSTATRCRQMAHRASDEQTRDYWLQMESFWLSQCRQDGFAVTTELATLPT
jgi:hypothetical protein